MNSTNTPSMRLVSEVLRYGMVSAAALGVDFGCLMLLAHFLHYLVAASISFLLGGVIAYLLSVKFVFEQRRVNRASTELGAFIALGLVGLAVNAAIMKIAVDHWVLSLAIGKGIAAGATFACNFALRKSLLFTAAKSNIGPRIQPAR